METNKLTAFENSASHDEVIQNLEHCYLCGTRLQFKHMSDYMNLKVTEETACPGCGVKQQAVIHTLH